MEEQAGRTGRGYFRDLRRSRSGIGHDCILRRWILRILYDITYDVMEATRGRVQSNSWGTNPA